MIFNVDAVYNAKSQPISENKSLSRITRYTGESRDPITRFNLDTCLFLCQTGTWISNVMYRGLLRLLPNFSRIIVKSLYLGKFHNFCESCEYEKCNVLYTMQAIAS